MGNVLVLAGRTGKQTHRHHLRADRQGPAAGRRHGAGGRRWRCSAPPTPAAELGGADTVVSIDHPALPTTCPRPTRWRCATCSTERSPRLLLLPNDTVGPGPRQPPCRCSWDAPLAAYVGRAWRPTATRPSPPARSSAARSSPRSSCAASAAICTVVAGAFPAAAGPGVGNAGGGRRSPAAPALDSPRTSAAAGDRAARAATWTSPPRTCSSRSGAASGPRTTSRPVQELADALGVPLSASRPVIDAGWLPKSRQVGKSGPEGQAEGLPVVRHLRRARAPGGHARRRADHRLQHRPERADLRRRALRHAPCDLFDLVPALVEKAGA